MNDELKLYRSASGSLDELPLDILDDIYDRINYIRNHEELSLIRGGVYRFKDKTKLICEGNFITYNALNSEGNILVVKIAWDDFDDDDNLCLKCEQNEQASPHPCPRNNDYQCTCCSDCERECTNET